MINKLIDKINKLEEEKAELVSRIVYTDAKIDVYKELIEEMSAEDAEPATEETAETKVVYNFDAGM